MAALFISAFISEAEIRRRTKKTTTERRLKLKFELAGNARKEKRNWMEWRLSGKLSMNEWNETANNELNK